MKKLLALLLCVVFLLVSGCKTESVPQETAVPTAEPTAESIDEPIEVPETPAPTAESDLVVYHTESGLSVSLPAGYQESETEGFVCYLLGSDTLFLAAREGNEELALIDATMDTMTIEAYAAISAEAFGLEGYAVDDAGMLSVSYTLEINGNNFFYYVCIIEGSDAFWTCNFACLEADAEKFLPQFKEWAQTIQVP